MLTRVEENLYFGSKPLKLGGQTNIAVDRLGSIRHTGKDYFPYGQENPSTTAGDKEKYATYKHDAATDLSYADQRYYATGAGRFMTADPYKASAGAGEPGSWNRYGYVGADPVNFSDPDGLTRWMVTVTFHQCEWTRSTATLACGPDRNLSFMWDDGLGGGTAHATSSSIGSRLNQTQRARLAEQRKDALAEAVTAGAMNDCEALAAFTDDSASMEASDSDFVEAFGALTNRNAASGLAQAVAGIRTTTRDQRLKRDGGASATGFRQQWANVGNEPSTNDQSHHFAAFFQLGFRAGRGLGAFAANLYDIHTANTGDQALGQWAAELGADLRSGKISQGDLAEKIRATLCK